MLLPLLQLARSLPHICVTIRLSLGKMLRVCATQRLWKADAASPCVLFQAHCAYSACCQSRGARRLARTGTAPLDVQAPTAALVPAPLLPSVPPTPGPVTPPWKWDESEDALWAYGAFFSLLALGSVPLFQTTRLTDLPYFVGLASVTIYIGAHRSLTTTQRQQLTLQQGALAPVAASAALFGCYLLIKYLPGFSPQLFFNAYFWLIGTIAITGATVPLLRRTTGALGTESLSIPLPEGLLLDVDNVTSVERLTFFKSDLLALALAVTATSVELASHHTNFTLNNLMACLIATDILQLVGIRSFRTAGAMLLGLLAYDVFWVFGSPAVVGDNVMLTVATSDLFVGPTRLLFPRLAGGEGEASSFPFSLLGLGDIAVPGILACLALRYDASRSVDISGRAAASIDAIAAALKDLAPGTSHTEMSATAALAADTAYDEFADRELRQRDASVAEGQTAAAEDGRPGSATRIAMSAMPVSDAVLLLRPYFKPVLASYVLGLLAAFLANEITKLGQPALLYIVPCTLSAVALTAVSRQELSRVWNFTDVASFGPLEALEDKKEDKADGKA